MQMHYNDLYHDHNSDTLLTFGQIPLTDLLNSTVAGLRSLGYVGVNLISKERFMS